jgi:hypothetical protein
LSLHSSIYHGVVHCLFVCHFSSGRSWPSMSWCCPLFICLSFFFWSELAEYVMVLSTVYLFVFFLLVVAGWVCHGVVHCLFVCHFSSGRSWLSMSWCCPLFICLSFFFWPELAEYVMVLSNVYMFNSFLWSVLFWYTASDYSFGIFKLFIIQNNEMYLMDF